MKSATVSAFALSTMLFSASVSFAQELATKDRIGLADAPKSLVVRLTNDSPNNSDPAIAEGYQKLFVDFIKKHPDWKLQMQFMSSDIGTEQAKMLEQAKAGNAPDCAAVDLRPLAVHGQSCACGLHAIFFEGRSGRPVPLHPQRHHR